MNKKAKKAYDKAMYYYEKGKIDKALEICEESLFEGLDNPSVLNFKGLLLYQKGILNEAITVWKINKELNNDDIAKKYIEDAIADEKRLDLYKQGEQALKQLKIDKALELFKSCSESDFNAIKVNTGIAMCYQKKGDLYKTKEYIDKALSIDQNAITAKNIEKELKEEGIYLEAKKSSKAFLVVITSLFVVITIAVGGYLIMLKLKGKDFPYNLNLKSNKITEENNKTDENKENEVKEISEVKPEVKSEEAVKEKPKTIKFDKNKLETLMANNDLYGIYEELKYIGEKPISNEDIEVYDKAINLMKNQGVSKFYEYGLKYFDEGNYADAGSSLDKAYTYCEGNSLKEHIIFYRASNSLKISDDKNALLQYEEYYNGYPDGSYVQEALYELALLNDSVDKVKGKKYANILISNFPNSLYVNDKIIGIAKG